MAARFQRVGEVEVDSRRRISLGRVGRREHARYIVEENDEGVIRLIPAKTIPAREAFVWENPKVMASLRKGMEQAATGDVHRLGSFAKHRDD
jgi:hypothetical protein